MGFLMQPLKLNLTQSKFEKLHELAGTKKANIQLPKKTLIDLLIDHSNMVKALEDAGVKMS